jgi:cell division protease FtsH
LSEEDETALREANVDYEFKTPSSNWFLSIAGLLLPVLLIIGFFVWMQRRAAGQMGNVMSIGRSRAKAYSQDRPSTTFADIAGYEGVKQEITEVVDFLRMPDRFREIGARVPKGMLLVGPPGTGKTLFARAVAGEAGVGFLSVTGSDFMEMFVGVGASRVRDLFQQARRMGRAIIFIDEIDSIGRKRGAGLGGGHDEREQTLNQMLSEMDGFETAEGIVILAATNRPDILDPALLRPGRFDRQIVVPLPEFEERKAILEVHARDKRIGGDVDLATMAKATPGMSGADLANLVNEAALVAVRRGSKVIERIDFENARDRVVLGALRESLVMTADEKRATAYHEGGHALLATVLPHGDPLHKVTILPRGMALGVTWSLPQERHTYAKEYFEDIICKAMGGRVAEKIVFNHLNSGAANDLEQATSIARRMVREWGMSERVGPMAWSSQQHVFLGEDLMSAGREYSDDTAKLLDEEIARVLTEQEDRATKLLTKHRRGLELIAEALLDKETIDGREVAQLIQQGLAESGDGSGSPIELNISHPDDEGAPATPNAPVTRTNPPPH